MKAFRFTAAAAALAFVLAACSVPFTHTEDLGLQLEAQRVRFVRATPPGLTALQAGPHDYSGSVTVTANKQDIDSRIDFKEIKLPVNFFDLQTEPEGSLAGIDSIIFSNFILSATLTDGDDTVQVSDLSVFSAPRTVDLTGATGTTFSLTDELPPFVLDFVGAQINDIIAGTSGQFTLTLSASFTAEISSDTVVNAISIAFQDEDATIKGSAGLR